MNVLFDAPQALLLAPALTIVVFFSHFKLYRIIYYKVYFFANPMVKVVKAKARRKRRLRTLVLKLVLALILALMAARPYVVVEKTVERDVNAEVTEILKAAKPAVVVVLDVSGSMGDAIPGGVKIDVAKKVIREFLKSVPGDVDLGFIAFNHEIACFAPPGTNKSRLMEIVDSLKPDGGTMYAYPLSTALNALRPYRAFNVSCMIIFITDGLPADKGRYVTLLDEYREKSIPIYTVYIGGGADPGVQETIRIAEETGGKQYTAETASKLEEVFKEMAERASQIAVKAKASVRIVERIKEKVGFSWVLGLSAFLLYLLLCYLRHVESKLTF